MAAVRLHPENVCPVCKSELSATDTAISCHGCEARYWWQDGVPVLMRRAPSATYDQPPPLPSLLGRFGHYYDRVTFAEQTIRERGFRRVLSVGEGTGEYVLALAAKIPEARFAAFDLEGARVATAERLRTMLGLANVHFAIADAHELPYRAQAFDFVFERGVFHLLPDKERHLAEIRRLAPGRWQLTEMANGRWYWRNWRVVQLGARILGQRGSLRDQRSTVEMLRRVGGESGWRAYIGLLGRHGFEARPIWHDVLVWRSHHRRIPRLIGARGASFGLEVDLSGPDSAPAG